MNFNLVFFYLLESSEYTITDITFPMKQQTDAPANDNSVDCILLLFPHFP
jgi:hypothetical protein